MEPIGRGARLRSSEPIHARGEHAGSQGAFQVGEFGAPAAKTAKTR